MEKSVYLVLLLLLTMICCLSPKEGSTSSIDRNIVLKDTFFLKREVREGQPYHVIYIDSTKNPIILNPLYGFDNQDSLNLSDYLQAISKKNVTLNKFNLYGLNSEWLPVYKFNSKYYLYKPSEWGGKNHKILSDSLMLHYWMDGYSPIAIQSVIRENNNIFHLKGKHYAEQDQSSFSELNIYIIDKQRMLTVWEYKTGYDSEYKYNLMVPKQFANQFSIIVNESLEKQPEVPFEKIDFRTLILGVKK